MSTLQKTRTIPGAINALEEVLRWAGLSPDEGPTAGGPLGPYIQVSYVLDRSEHVV